MQTMQLVTSIFNNNCSYLHSATYCPPPLPAPEAYAYNLDLLKLDTQHPCTSVTLTHGMLPTVKTPLQWQERDKRLLHHLDQKFRSYIVNVIHFGFRVGYNHPHTC